jgi:arginyl-tRNA synthetase
MLEQIKELIGIKELKIAYPYSHLAVPVFLLNKYNLKPEDLEKLDFIDKVWTENNFLNIKLNPKILKYLKNEKKEKKETVLIEHTSNNPTGPLHIGRIRSTLIGDFLVRAMKYLGYRVKAHFYVNDLGRQVILIYLAKEKGLKKDPKELKLNKFSEKYLNREDYETFLYYVKANEESSNFEEEIKKLLEEAEKNEEFRKKLKETAEYTLKGIKKTFERLNVNFDSFDYESDFLEDTKNYLKLLAQKLNIEDHPYIFEYKNEKIYLTREDGTTTYLSRDIAYHKYKEKLADLLINVLGEDHKREFLILKELLNIIGFEKKLDAAFFSFLTFEGQKISTRKGNVITVDELIDMGKEIIKGNEEQKEKLAIASLKVYLLNNNINKPIDFRWNLALKTEGETGVYLMYTFARINSLLEKSKFKDIDFKDINLDNFSEEMKDLLFFSLLFDHYLESAVKKKNPAIFVKYLFDLAKTFNKLYNKEKILDSENEKEKIFLIKQLKKLFEKAFEIINIPILTKIEQN